MSRIITLTTDFGHQDAFVGIMKGVILSIAPDVRLVDLCHEIPPQDMVAAALQMEAALPYFPTDTIHLVVVDPGVGTDRAAVATETEFGLLVGPDNGVLTAAIGGVDRVRRAVRLTRSEYRLQSTSRTFHGRDIFAPCAAHLAVGVPLEELGEAAHDLVSIGLPQPVWENGVWRVHVIRRDSFGNLMTDLRKEQLDRLEADEVVVLLPDGRSIPVLGTYAGVAPGAFVAYVGSSGRLEIAVRNGDAAARLTEVGEVCVRSINGGKF